MLTKSEIVNKLKKLGIFNGDTVLVHSSFKSLGEVEGGAGSVIDAFFEAIGDEGTLVFPTLCQNDWLNVYKNWHMDAESDVGYLTNYFRKLPGALRSNQATHSVSAIGRHAEWLTKTHGESGLRYGEFGDTPFASDSPWDKMYALDAKMVFIGVNLRYCTLRHFVEYYYIDAVLRFLESFPDYEEQKLKIWHYDRWEDEGLWLTLDSLKIGDRLKEKEKLSAVSCGDALLTMVSASDYADEAFSSLENNDFSLLRLTEDGMPDPIIPWLAEFQRRGFSFKAPDFGRTVR